MYLVKISSESRITVETKHLQQPLFVIYCNKIKQKEISEDGYDNAVMECFFKYLKKEETNRRTYSSFDELKLSIFQYIHGFYNSFRPHSHNNGLSPDLAEVNFL